MNQPWSLADQDGPRPDLRDYPIPVDAQPTHAWSPVMLQLTAHIGAYNVLRLVDHYGGINLYVPVSHIGWHVANVIGAEAAAKLTWACRREQIEIPTARHALDEARRGGIIAAVRARKMTLDQAAWILRIRRSYVSRLAKQSEEGKGCAPVIPTIAPDPRQLQLFPE